MKREGEREEGLYRQVKMVLHVLGECSGKDQPQQQLTWVHARAGWQVCVRFEFEMSARCLIGHVSLH